MIGMYSLIVGHQYSDHCGDTAGGGLTDITQVGGRDVCLVS